MDANKLIDALQSIARRWEESEKTSQLAWFMVEDARAALREIACRFPDCGCPEARLCLGIGGANNAAMELINPGRGGR